MRKETPLSHPAVILGLGVALSLPLPTLAQEGMIKEADEASQPETKPKTEKMKVTGSRIRRTQVEGVSSVITIDRQKIEESGVGTVSELLRNMSISTSGSYATPTVNSGGGTTSQVDIRGLGAENTLVLLDGRRLPDEAGEGVIDISTIPMAAVERIEILKDSASAIYGSDAAGGVVNIITRKDIDGTIISSRATAPQSKGNQQTDFSILNGFQKGKLKNLTMLSYRKVEPVFYRDRDWTANSSSIYSNPANYSISAKGYKITAHPDCPVSEDSRIVAEQDGNALCTYNYGQTMAFSPDQTQVGFLNNLEYELNSSSKVFASVRATRTNSIWNMAPNAGQLTIPQNVVQANLKRFGLAEDDIPSDVNIYYRAEPWGLRNSEQENTMVGATVGIEGALSYAWDWTLSVGRSENKRDTYQPQGFFLEDQFIAALKDGTFSPFELVSTNPQFVNDIAYEPYEIVKTASNTANFGVSGEWVEMPAGPIGVAVGVQRTEQFYDKNIDEQSELGNVFGVNENKGSTGERDISSAYVELMLPVTERFEIQLAARHDVYSDFGGTTNPSAGFKYLPDDWLLLRGNVGTGFKAPTLSEINRGTTVGLLDLNDTPNCQGICEVQTTEVEIATEGNPDLKEETSFGYTFGFLAEPVRNTTFGADYWYLRTKDIVVDVDPQDVLDGLNEGRSYDGVEITRTGGDPAGRLERITIPTLNLGMREESGVDLSLAYRYRLDAGPVLGLGSDYSRKFYTRSTPYPGEPAKDILGERGRPRWRAVNSTSVTFARAHTFSLRQNLYGQQKNATKEGVISEHKNYDFQYQWSHPWRGSITLGAINVFDQRFPLDQSARAGSDDVRVQELYAADARTYYVQVEQRF